MAITTRPAKEVYQALTKQYEQASQNFLKGSSQLGNVCLNLDVRYNILNQGKGGMVSNNQLIDERDAFSIAYWRYNALFQSAVTFEQELQQGIGRIDSRIPADDADEDSLSTKRRRLNEHYAHIGTIRKRMETQLSTLENSLKLFHAIVSNQGQPLRFDQAFLARWSPLPSLSDALLRQQDLSDKCLQIEKDELSTCGLLIQASVVTDEDSEFDDDQFVVLERVTEKREKKTQEKR
jgi:hypothetical protein